MKVISCKCPMCGKETIVIMTNEEYERYTNNESLINIFPEWTPTEREHLITGLCYECQDTIFTIEE